MNEDTLYQEIMAYSSGHEKQMPGDITVVDIMEQLQCSKGKATKVMQQMARNSKNYKLLNVYGVNENGRGTMKYVLRKEKAQ